MVFLRVHSVVPSCQMSSSNRSRSDRREFTEGLSYLFSISRAWSRTVRIYAAIASLGFALGAGGHAFPQSGADISPAARCLAANHDLSLGAKLPRTAARLRFNEPLVIVAIGSSSTVGLWMLRSTATYPEIMRRELSQLRGSNAIQVINSGRVGETIQGNVARFERDVFSYRPDLVVWQLGTNDVVLGGRLDPQLRGMVLEGVRKLKASGADVILMDLQYAVRVLASNDYSEMEAIIREVARLESVGLFSRFALMRKSIEAGVSPDELVSWDGLHNTAEGYDCIGRALARLVSSSVGWIQ